MGLNCPSITELENKIRNLEKKLGEADEFSENSREEYLKTLRAFSTTISELREKESQYKLLAENSTDVIWILQPDGSFSYVSPSVKKLRGYSPEEAVKQSLYEVMTEDSARKVKLLIQSLRKKDSGSQGMDSFQTEVEQLCSDGSSVWTEVNITPIWTDRDELKEILGVSRNIQGKRIAQQKAIERNKTLEGIFRSSPTGIGMVVDRNFTMVNDRFCEMLGYSREELLGKNSRLVYETEEEYLRVGKKKYENIRKTGTGNLYTRFRRKDGSVIDCYLSSSPVDINSPGKGVIFNILDVTEIRDAEQQVIESDRKYRQLFENSPEAIVIVDNLGFITDCNPAFCEIYERKQDEVLGKHFSRSGLLSPRKMPSYLKLFNKMLVNRETGVYDFDWISSNGNSRSGVAHVAPIIEKDKTKGLQILLKDTTRQKEVEKNLIQAKEKAEENIKLKTAFLETMSHELRTPLNAVIGFSNLIKDEDKLENIAEMNNYISENGKKLLTIIESIFDISVLETNSLKVKSENVDLKDLFSELEHTLVGMIEHSQKKNITTYYQPDKRVSDPVVVTDGQRLKQLLTNLLTNAVRFTDRGSIRYGYSYNNNDIEFFVSDTGIGIPSGKRELIFEKFRQLDYSPTRTRGGLGLGLAICKEISTLLGGEIRLESTPDKGSSFYFKLPLNKSGINAAGNPGIDLRGKNILIVEDIESNYLYLEKLLSDSGAVVSWAQTGEEAISATTILDNIDLILMDIRMPDMNGYEITREIKNIRPDIPIVAQTAYAMQSDQQEALDAGCSAHISKPIRVDEIISVIAELMPENNRRKYVI